MVPLRVTTVLSWGTDRLTLCISHLHPILLMRRWLVQLMIVTTLCRIHLWPTFFNHWFIRCGVSAFTTCGLFDHDRFPALSCTSYLNDPVYFTSGADCGTPQTRHCLSNNALVVGVVYQDYLCGSNLTLKHLPKG